MVFFGGKFSPIGDPDVKKMGQSTTFLLVFLSNFSGANSSSSQKLPEIKNMANEVLELSAADVTTTGQQSSQSNNKQFIRSHSSSLENPGTLPETKFGPEKVAMIHFVAINFPMNQCFFNCLVLYSHIDLFFSSLSLLALAT
jgi:hypothetical protein